MGCTFYDAPAVVKRESRFCGRWKFEKKKKKTPRRETGCARPAAACCRTGVVARQGGTMSTVGGRLPTYDEAVAERARVGDRGR